MTERDFAKTGINGLDTILSGGIPRGNLTLVEGAMGTGKTTLGVEFIFRGATEFNEPGLIVLFEVAPDRLIRDAAGFGWDLPELERQGRLKIVFTTRQVFEQEMQEAGSLLLEEAGKIGARRIFIDSFGRLALRNNNNHNGSRDPRDAFHILAEGLYRENLTGMLALEVVAEEEVRRADVAPEEFIADTVVLLRLEPVERAVQRSIEIVKSRGHEYQMGRHSFRIVDGRGLEVYRRVQAPRDPSRELAAAFDPTTRVPSGVPGLDELLRGGYFVGSTTLVVGISGVGKSVMGLHYIAEGARLGERSLMLTLDEPPAQVLRNAASIGIDLQGAIDRGAVRLYYDSPQEIEIDRHFHRIEQIVREFKPRRAVIDSLSTYGSSLGAAGRTFRDFFHAIVALMKEHQVTAIYNHENPEMFGMSSMMGDYGVSSLVDNIILLNWVELGDTLRQAVTVSKMRSSPISRVTREYEIVNGAGMRVLARVIPPSAQPIPFAGYHGLLARSPARHPSER
jgi:circadian clock protein KaiC